MSKTFFNDGKWIFNTSEIESGFSNCFLNIGSTLDNNIDTVSDNNHQYFMKDKIESSIYMNLVTDVDIVNIVNKYKNRTSKDFMNMIMINFKTINQIMVSPFTHICVTFLYQRYLFPYIIKIAKVIPINKSGKTDEFRNLRPISLLLHFFQKL